MTRCARKKSVTSKELIEESEVALSHDRRRHPALHWVSIGISLRHSPILLRRRVEVGRWSKIQSVGSVESPNVRLRNRRVGGNVIRVSIVGEHTVAKETPSSGR